MAAFLVIVAVALAVRLYIILALPPTSDVYYYDKEAAQLVLGGINPYGHAFTGIPADLATPGANDVFAYLPFTALFAVPFYLLGDVRFAVVVADLMIGLCLFQFAGRWSLAAAAIFLLVPTTYYVNDAAFAAAFVALSLALEARKRDSLASAALGIALASSLFAWLALPFFGQRYASRGRAAKLAVAAVVFAVITLPFVAAGPSEFIYDVLLFHLGRPSPGLFISGGPFGFALNPSLSGLMVTLTGESAPFYLRGASVLVALVLLLRIPRAPREHALEGGILADRAGILRCALFVSIAVLVLPSVFFFAYLEFPAVLVLTWLASR